MSRPNPGKLAAFVAGLLVLTSLPVWVKGGLYLTNFEGDALHLADIVLRMADGQKPHLDFLTPIGALSFWPIVLFVQAGLPLGMAFAAGQTLVAAVVCVGVWRAAASRLPTITGYVFSGICVVLLTSLAHGYDTANTAVSMHYNRWAWVLSIVAIVLAVLPPRDAPRPTLDGALAGVALAATAMIKITFFVAFVPVLVIVALLRKEGRLLAAALVSGLITGLLFLLLFGFDQFLGYVGDLRAVVDAPLRGSPGLSLAEILVSPAHLSATLMVIAAVLVCRRHGRPVQGLALLLLLPAFTYVTWQNFGNDSVWLVAVAAILAALYDRDRGGLAPLGLLSVVAFVLALPLVAVHGGSGLRLLSQPQSIYVVLVPENPRLSDVFMPNYPAHLVRARTVQNEAGAPYEALASRIELPEAERLGDKAFSECQLLTGIKGALEIGAMVAPEGAQVFVADVLTSQWLYRGLPLKGGSPWNYGTLNGFENATHVLVPFCAVSVKARRALLKELSETEAGFAVEAETPTHLLFRIER